MGHLSRIYALGKWASFRSGARAPIPAITAGPSLFARSSARWHGGPVARTLAWRPRARKAEGAEAANGFTQFKMEHVGPWNPRCP